MRKIIIVRRKGFIDKLEDTRIISNTVVLGILKKDEEKVEFEVNKSEQTIQAEFIGTDGRAYRSNAYFALYGKKNIVLYFTMSGTQMILSVEK